MKKHLLISIIIIMAFGFTQSINKDGGGQIRLSPRLLNYQGYLTDTLGNPINDSLDLIFKIFDAAGVGNLVWTETQLEVPVIKGIFHVLLGSATQIPDSVFTNSPDRWLEIRISGQNLSPRTRIVSTPYAYTAAFSDTALYARVAAADNDWIISGTNQYSAVSGNVGIGIASPRTKLDVIGTICGGVLDTVFSTYGVLPGGYHNIAGDASDDTSVTISGGWYNAASADYSFIGGGSFNSVSGRAGTISGGSDNMVLNSWSSIGGGSTNAVSGQMSAVAGGIQNQAASDYSFVGGGAGNLVNASGTVINGGSNNRIDGTYSVIGGGERNLVRGNYSGIFAGYADTIDYNGHYSYLFGINSNLTQDSTFMVDMPHIWFGTEAAGYQFPSSRGSSSQVMVTDVSGQLVWSNSPAASHWTVTDSVLYTNLRWGLARGGAGNMLFGTNRYTHTNFGAYACTTGTIGQNYSYITIGGGYCNRADSTYSTIAGGTTNKAMGSYSFIGGGFNNFASGYMSLAGGGSTNTASGYIALTGGGWNNVASGRMSAVLGGYADTAMGEFSSVLAGYSNLAGNSTVDTAATVSGGRNNSAIGKYATASGGRDNISSGDFSTVGGGYMNIASSVNYSTVSGGSQNTASGEYSTVSGGGTNYASGFGSTTCGGRQNTTSGDYSVISGGSTNYIYADYATITGGIYDTIAATGNYSFLFGISSKLTQDSTFMVDMPHIWFGDEAAGYQFPVSRGTNGQVIVTNGSGILSWSNPPSTSHWTVTDTVLYTNLYWGLARGGAANYLGGNKYSHTNWGGYACSTGTGVTGAGYVTITGGYSNRADSSYAAVVGGYRNIATGTYSVIAGGANNTTFGRFSTIAGGANNKAVGLYSFVGGGASNNANEYFALIAGGESDTVLARWGGILSGRLNKAGDASTDTAATVIGGWNNAALNKYAFIGGGNSNTGSGDYAVVTGGYSNTASMSYSSVSGGYTNNANGSYSTIAGGSANTANGSNSAIAGGSANTANGSYSTIAGGYANTADGSYSTIAGGYINTAYGTYSTVAGGISNTADTAYSFIGGGTTNNASGRASVIGGGNLDTTQGYYAAILGGLNNNAGRTLEDTFSVVINGRGNNAEGKYSFVGNGRTNNCLGHYGFIGNGLNNTCDSSSATYYPTIISGFSNYVNGYNATVINGYYDTLTSSSDYSLVHGRLVYLTTPSRVVFFDSTYSGYFGVNRDDHNGGIDYPIHVGTHSTNGNGAYLTAAGVWTAGFLKSRSLESQSFDGSMVLNRLDGIIINQWRDRETKEQHIGPLAQDFYKAFGCGTGNIDDDSTHIAALDMAGVSLRAVQELTKMVRDQQSEIAELKAEIAKLKN